MTYDTPATSPDERRKFTPDECEKLARVYAIVLEDIDRREVDKRAEHERQDDAPES